MALKTCSIMTTCAIGSPHDRTIGQASRHPPPMTCARSSLGIVGRLERLSATTIGQCCYCSQASGYSGTSTIQPKGSGRTPY